ncbi:OmpA family protein [Granulicella paludicola]|uniref:OmpA family protein n=1 Tax=Granulicella paludicola TaxID=474951 RepID=UPI0021DFD6E5|nr:OmpA family protein [Granulicella paludicola]
MNIDSLVQLSIKMLAVLLVATGGSQIYGQEISSPATEVPKFDVSLGYNFLRSNAPPSGCSCFDANGGYASAAFHVTRWLSFEGEVTGQHQTNISNLGQSLTLLTFAGGPKVSYPGHRLVPFGEVLIGGAHGSDSYFPTGTTYSSTASSLTLSTGGGLEVGINKLISVRAFDVQYLKTELPNGTNNTQNHLMASAGIIFKFGDVIKKPATIPYSFVREDNIALSCTSSVSNLDQGDTLEIYGSTLTEPDKLEVTYDWISTVGKIVGTGHRVMLDTQGVPPGNYHVIGHAVTVGQKTMSADCDIPFRIKTEQQTVKAPTPVPAAPETPRVKEFHENVPDALFDYDSAAIRPDTQTAINHAAVYLQSHPDIYVMVGGYADDRGAVVYNLKLGERRAEAARMALIAAGVSPERVQIVSYGKEVQVCTAENETCRQQNRRAAFNMHP